MEGHHNRVITEARLIAAEWWIRDASIATGSRRPVSMATTRTRASDVRPVDPAVE